MLYRESLEDGELYKLIVDRSQLNPEPENNSNGAGDTKGWLYRYPSIKAVRGMSQTADCQNILGSIWKSPNVVG